MARYLISGVAGFIAARVAEMLLADGHSVIGVDELNGSYDVRLKEWRLVQLQAHPAFSFCRVDICDRSSLLRVFRSASETRTPPFDAAINLAARVGVRQSVTNPWIYLATNVNGALNVLELCRGFDVQKFVLASTSSLYGAHNPRPFREDADTDRPCSPYAASKKAAEALCHSYHELYGIDVTVLRYFTVYGPAGRPDMAPFRFVQWISEGRPLTLYGDGSQERDFTYVDDIARGTIAALRPAGYEVINLGSDRPLRLADFITLIETAVGRCATIQRRPSHPADVPATWANIERARQHLGWDPQTPVEEGVQQLVRWYQQNRHWAKDVSTR